jgi:hypothetical protein
MREKKAKRTGDKSRMKRQRAALKQVLSRPAGKSAEAETLSTAGALPTPAPKRWCKPGYNNAPPRGKHSPTGFFHDYSPAT